MGHFVLSPREREKRDRRDEREGQGRKRNRNESEETEETGSTGAILEQVPRGSRIPAQFLNYKIFES